MKNNKTKNGNRDLTSDPKSVASYLKLHIPFFNERTADEIIEILKNSKNFASVSPEYLEKMVNRAMEIKHSKGMLVRYVSDIYLAGCGMSVINPQKRF